jgi:hypothetical protein
MGTLSERQSGQPDSPLTDADQAALRDEVLRFLGKLPFAGGLVSRSLWLILLGTSGIWTRAVIPVDDKLTVPDPADTADLCRLIASCMRHPMPGQEHALVVLRRPGPAKVSDADEYVFRTMAEAVGHDTTPWTFYVTAPGWARRLAHPAQ